MNLISNFNLRASLRFLRSHFLNLKLNYSRLRVKIRKNVLHGQIILFKKVKGFGYLAIVHSLHTLKRMKFKMNYYLGSYSDNLTTIMGNRQ